MASYNFKLNPKQKQAIRSNNRFILLSGGVGSGKTSTLCFRVIKEAVEQPGILILVVAYTFPQLRDTTLREFKKFCPPEIISTYNKTTHTYTLTNGSEIFFRAYNHEDKPKSLTVGMIACEELTGLPEDICRELMFGRLRQQYGNKNNKVKQLFLGATNPASLSHYVYKYFFQGILKNSVVITSTTYDNRRYLPPEYIEQLDSLKLTNLTLYNRMVKALWGSMEGLIYSLPLTQRITYKDLPLKDILSWDETTSSSFDMIIGGIDFGYNNPTSISIIGKRGEKFYKIDEFYKTKVGNAEMIETVLEIQNTFNVAKFYPDPSEAGLIHDLEEAGVRIGKANNDVFAGIVYVQSLIARGLYHITDNCTNTLKEIDSYVWDKKHLDKPVKVFDHAMDSDRYALYSFKFDNIYVNATKDTAPGARRRLRREITRGNINV